MMDDMGHDTNQTLGESPGIVRPSATRGHLCTPLHGYAGKRTRSWRPGGPETRGTTACCIRSKSSRLVLHPFRDVNTRSQFVFFNQLSEQAGWVIDWNLIDAHVFAHARTMAIVRDEKGIDALLRPALVSAADLGRREELRERMEQTRTEFFRPRPARDRGALDAELEKALRRREAQLGDPNPIRRDGPTSSGPSLSL